MTGGSKFGYRVSTKRELPVIPQASSRTARRKASDIWHDSSTMQHPRTVGLYERSAHVTDVSIVTDLDGDTGVVDYTIDAERADDVETRVVLRSADGQEVATNTGPSGTLQVPDVHKWAPGDGYLYDLEIQLVQGETVIDSYTKVRYPNRQGTESSSDHGIPSLQGVGKHEDVPVTARGPTTRTCYPDFELLNGSVRTPSAPSHPYSRLPRLSRPTGLVLSTRPQRGLNMSWVASSSAGRAKDLPPETANDATQKVMLRRSANIARAKPSHFGLEHANEPESRRRRQKTLPTALRVARRATRPSLWLRHVMLAPHGKAG